MTTFFITADSVEGTGISPFVYSIYSNGIDEYFINEDYGHDVHGISLVLMCRWNSVQDQMQQRKRFTKKDKLMSMDIMLDFNLFKSLDQNSRNKYIAKRIVKELPAELGKRKFKDFDLERFTKDLEEQMSKLYN